MRRLEGPELVAYDVVPRRLAKRVRVVEVPILPNGADGMTVGSVIFVDLPRGCTREGTRVLKMAETRICEMVEGTPMWLPLYDIPLSSVTEEIGVDCER